MPDSKYTNFLLILRYTCLVWSLIVAVLYLTFYRRIPFQLRTFEHKYIAALVFSLILFNDPFFGISIYSGNAVWAILSTIFVT